MSCTLIVVGQEEVLVIKRLVIESRVSVVCVVVDRVTAEWGELNLLNRVARSGPEELGSYLRFLSLAVM